MKIRLADCLADRRLDKRLAGEPRADLAGRAVERSADRDIRIGHDVGPNLEMNGGLREHVLVEELVDRLGDRRLGLGPIPFLASRRLGFLGLEFLIPRIPVRP